MSQCPFVVVVVDFFAWSTFSCVSFFSASVQTESMDPYMGHGVGGLLGFGGRFPAFQWWLLGAAVVVVEVLFPAVGGVLWAVVACDTPTILSLDQHNNTFKHL